MLKIFFWILIAANIVLFVFQQTYFDAPSGGKREPERLTYQYQEDKVRLLSVDEINRAIDKAKATGQDTAALQSVMENAAKNVSENATANITEREPESASGICVEIGRFTKSEATAFEQQLASLSLNPGNVKLAPIQEGSAYMVFIPPAANPKNAEAKIAELKKKGIESFLIKDQTKLRGAISLGVFKTREAAASYAAEMGKAGLAGLQIVPRGATVQKRVYRLNNLNDEQQKALDAMMGHFPGQSMQQCQPISKSAA